MTLKAPTLLIRADSSLSIGSGHISRCLNLAQAWQEESGPVLLLAAEITPTLAHRAENMGVGIVRLPMTRGSPGDSELTAGYAENAWWLVLDGYCFDLQYQRRVQRSGTPTLVLDDVVGERHFACQALLNQNAHARPDNYAELIPEGCSLLLGPKYALLPGDMKSKRVHSLRSRNRADRILVSLGGGDNTDAAAFALAALDGVRGAPLTITVLAAGSDPQKLRRLAESSYHSVDIVEGYVTDMPQRLATADVAVIGGGTTSWEALSLGLPSAIWRFRPTNWKVASR